MSDRERVHLVDDDPDVLKAVALLLRGEGYDVAVYERGQALLEAVGPEDAGCLLLDVRLPDINGLDLQAELNRRGVGMPVVFITGHGDVPLAVQAVSAGALDFLEKPFDDQRLLERVGEAMERDRESRERAKAKAEIEARLERLTAREREVMEGILRGKLNKVIAYDLGVSTRTIEIHRARVLEKLEARNASEMVRLVLSTDAYHDWLI